MGTVFPGSSEISQEIVMENNAIRRVLNQLSVKVFGFFAKKKEFDVTKIILRYLSSPNEDFAERETNRNIFL